MRSSSLIRRQHSFAPWLVALLLGASANVGLLIHELRDDAEQPTQIVIQVDHGEHGDHGATAAGASPEPTSAEHGRRARSRVRARHRPQERRPSARPAAELDLDLWIEQVDRYRYAIDRRALDRLAIAELDARAIARLDELGVLAHAVTLAEPLELRNIQQGTQLWLLGLRNGDQLRSIATRGEAALEEVELSLLRRGRAVTIVYELS